MANAKTKFVIDPIVASILGKAHEPLGDLVCIGGFIGDSPRADHIRLFTKINFSECLDIPLDAVAGEEKILTAGMPAGTYLWVHHNALLGVTSVDSVEGQSKFLEGKISDSRSSKINFKLAAGGRGGGPTAQGSFFSTPICSIIASVATVSLVICTRTEGCTDDPPEPPEPTDPDPDPVDIDGGGRGNSGGGGFGRGGRGGGPPIQAKTKKK